MKILELLGVVQAYESWHVDYRLHSEADALAKFALLLKDVEKSTAQKVIVAIRQSRPVKATDFQTRAGAQNALLLLVLARIAALVERSNKRQSDALRAFADVLREESTWSEDLISSVRSRLAHIGSKKSQRAKLAYSSAEEYAGRLERAQTDLELHQLTGEFRAAGFKKNLLDQIAHRFAKSHASYKSKAEAIKDIERRFTQRKRSANELEYLDKKKVTPW